MLHMHLWHVRLSNKDDLGICYTIEGIRILIFDLHKLFIKSMIDSFDMSHLVQTGSATDTPTSTMMEMVPLLYRCNHFLAPQCKAKPQIP